MATAATYRIGPSDFFTAGDLSADADTVKSQIALLDAQLVNNDAVSVDFHDQWTSFENSFSSFYGDHFGGFFSSLLTAVNDANRDQLIQYERQLADFQAAAQNFGASVIAPVAPSSGSGDTLGAQLAAQGILPSTTTLVIVAVAVIAVLFVWKS